jgi:tetratricopeptide (TPR) repeat protein
VQELIENIVAAMKHGRHAEALDLSRKLVQSFPYDEGALSLLAVSEQNGGDMEVARDLLKGLTRNHPGTWQHWNNLGNVLRLLGDLEPAADAYAQALALNQASPRLRANLGLLNLNLGNFSLAREHLIVACGMQGSEPSMRVWAAVACQASADDATARELIAPWQGWPSLSDEVTLELGWLLFQLGEVEAGESLLSGEFLDEAVRARATARRVLGLERLNRVDEAADLIARLPEPARIADRQARMEVLNACALIAVRGRDFGTARAHYEQALSMDLPPQYRKSLYFGLAKACDQLGDRSAAMDALQCAHASDLSEQATQQRNRLTGTGLLALLEVNEDVPASMEWSTEDAPAASESPVFLVGFPRSGTTLLEQMLAAHEEFESADEQPMIQRALERLRELGARYPQDLGTLTPAVLAELRNTYWIESRKSVAPEAGTRLVDKHPLNFLALPLIRRLFPNSPLIFSVRHPCDSILSCYMQNFRDPRLAAECTSLERLGGLYLRLTERWIRDSASFPEHMLTCRHEDLVTDPERQLRRIGDLLGVSDISSMLTFSEHARLRGFIGTPSYAQVVQGLNSEAVGRWTHYREYLEPILPTITPIMDHWGYQT